MQFGKYSTPLETRLSLVVDDQELNILIDSLKVATREHRSNGNMFQMRMTELLTLKLMAERMRYQDRNVSILEEKYGI